MLSNGFYYIWPLVSNLCTKITDLMQAFHFRGHQKKTLSAFHGGSRNTLISQFQSFPLGDEKAMLAVPAVNSDGSSIRGVAGFHPAEEVEERSGILWHAVIWPGRKLELAHFPPLATAALVWQDDRLLGDWLGSADAFRSRFPSYVYINHHSSPN